MRFIITLITSLILLIPASGQGQWEIVEVEIIVVPVWPGDQEPVDCFLDVQFIDRDIGFFIGARDGGLHNPHCGVLYKTKDGGRTWNRIYENGDVAFLNIHIVNDSLGFASDSWLGGLYTSSDGGYSWIRDTIMGDVVDIFFVNDSTGWVVQSTKIFRTTNGGG